MAGFSLRTLCTTGCLMAVLLAGGNVRAISFSAIEVPLPDWAPKHFASPLAVSPNGDRVAGLVAYRDIVYDCGSYLGCSPAFTWTLPSGTQLPGGEMGQWGMLPGEAEQAVHLGDHHSLFNTNDGPLFTTAGSPDVTSIEFPTRVHLVSRDMTPDGATIIGSYADFVTGDRKAFRWTSQSGLELLSTPLEVGPTHATVVSDDGSVIAGRNFRWTETGGSVVVANFLPEGITNDGSQMVGHNGDRHNSLPLIWKTETGTTDLELFAWTKGGAAFDTTGDGSRTVGQVYGIIESGPLDGLSGGVLLPESTLIWLDPSQTSLTHTAVLWDANGNVHNLQTWLTQNHNLGDELAGWSLISANAISADGRVIAGVGINPEGHFQGWVVDLSPAAVVPEPATSVMLLTAASLIIAGWILTRRPG